jgi:hypothetical protein
MFRIYYNTYWHELWASCINSQSTNHSAIHFVSLSSTMTLLSHIIQSEFFPPSSNAFASSSLSIQLNNDTVLTPRSCSFLTWSRIQFITDGETTITKCLQCLQFVLIFISESQWLHRIASVLNGVINKWFPASVVSYENILLFVYIRMKSLFLMRSIKTFKFKNTTDNHYRLVDNSPCMWRYNWRSISCRWLWLVNCREAKCIANVSRR